MFHGVLFCPLVASPTTFWYNSHTFLDDVWQSSKLGFILIDIRTEYSFWRYYVPWTPVHWLLHLHRNLVHTTSTCIHLPAHLKCTISWSISCCQVIAKYNICHVHVAGFVCSITHWLPTILYIYKLKDCLVVILNKINNPVLRLAEFSSVKFFMDM